MIGRPIIAAEGNIFQVMNKGGWAMTDLVWPPTGHSTQPAINLTLISRQLKLT